MIDDAANDALDALSSCQCCLLGGQQKSLKTLYFHLGKTEIYSDMLKECFDIRLSVGSEKSGICEVCVGRLRDASNFKQQVQHSQLELKKRLKRALGIPEEEPVAAVKRETDGATTSYILLDEESTVELSDDDGASPVMSEGQVKSEEADEDGTKACPPEEPAAIVKSEVDEDDDGTNGNLSEEPAAIVKSEKDEDDDGTNGNLSDDGPSIKSEKPDEDVTSDDDLSPVCFLSARARQQLAMTCSVRLERLDGLEAHACHICHMTFEHESSLATHMMEHDSQIQTDTYICDVCKQQFTLKGDLERHNSTHAREKRFHCEICYKSFPWRSDLKRHVRIHSAEKPFQCEICYKSFTLRSNLKKHIRIHNAEKPFQCEICYKSFTWRSNFKRHVREHTGEKPFKCEICYDSFTRRCHLKIHNAEKPFKCDICNKQFNWTSSLKRHTRKIHAKQKSFKCDDKSKNQFALIKYVKTDSRKIYICDICNKPFSQKSDLERHVVVHTGEKPYSCDMCNRHFSDKSSMRKHVKFILHAFKCDICNKQFLLKEELITHVSIHTG